MHEPKTFLSQERILITPEFIEKNRLSLSRTQQELLMRYNSSNDFLGFSKEILIDYMSFESAKPLLKDDYVQKVESGEETWSYIDSIEIAAQDFLDYMNFAWGKAEDERGISASRSISKLGEWLWLMGRADLHDLIKDENLYNPYGAPALIEVCNRMGIAVPESLVEFSQNKC